jgi:hypothetical protein
VSTPSRPEDNQDHEPDRDVWADLVARLEATDSSGVPDPPDLGEPPAPASEFPSLRQAPRGPLTPRGPRDWDEPDPEELGATDEGDFVPEAPGPVLAGRPDVVIACMAAVAIPVLMLVLMIFVPDRVPRLGWAVMGLSAVGALVYLAWRLPRHRSDDSDDGARV